MLICNISLCSYPCVGILVICILPLGVSAQRDNNGQRVWADSVMRVLYDNQDLDAAVKSKLADSVFYIGQNLRDTCLQIEARTKQATYLDVLSKPRWGKLFTVDTTKYPNGTHKLRLRIVHKNSNYAEYFTTVTIHN